MIRRCSRCATDKSITEFVKDKRKSHGYGYICKRCCARRAKRRALSYRNQQRKAPITKICGACQRDLTADAYHTSRGSHDGLQSNCKECRSRTARRYYKNNRAKVQKRNCQYTQANPDLAAARTAQYRAAKLQRTLSQGYTDAIKQFYKEARRLTDATGVQHHVDHIVPLRGRLVSGLHVPWNLQILTASDNCSKGNKWEI